MVSSGVKRYLVSVLASLFVGWAPPSEGQLLEYFTDVSLKKGRLTTERRFLIQINNKDMDWLSDITLFYKDGDELEIIEASILDQQGKVIRKLTTKEITTRHSISDISLYEDDLVKKFTLRWNQYPYRIVYHTRITTTRFIYLCRWHPLYYYSLPVQNARLRLRYPADYAVSVFHSAGTKGDSLVSKQEIIREWSYQNIAPVKAESYSPPPYEQLPTILVAPKVFHFGVDGSLESWSSYGDWQERLNAGTNDLPLAEKYRISQLVKDAPDTITRIKRLYHYLQDNTRYINVSMDIGGLKAFPASYVSNKKYGDCKALTVYMRSLLGEIGVPSFYTNVNVGESPNRIIRSVPGPQFNHIILCVPLGKDTLWLENTSNFHPFNYLGTQIGNEALVINGSESRLIPVPKLTSAQVLCRKSYDIRVKEDGSAHGNARWELRGREFEAFRNFQANENQSRVKERIEEALAPTGAQLADFTVHPADRDATLWQVDLQLQFNDPLRSAGKSLLLKPIPVPVPISLAEIEAPAKRTTPLRIHNPIHREETITYHLPMLEGYQAVLPQDSENKTPFGNYLFRSFQDGTTIRLERRIELYGGDIPLSSYAGFYGFLREIEDIARASAIVLSPKK